MQSNSGVGLKESTAHLIYVFHLIFESDNYADFALTT